MDNQDNRFQYITTAVPGAPGTLRFRNPPVQPKGFFSRLKDAIIDLVTEEVPQDERPIGISQLSRRTFRATDDYDQRTIVRGGRVTADYRFRQQPTGSRY